MDWSGRATTGSYSDSKLFVTTLALAVARLWPDVLSNVVDPDGCPRRWAAPAPGEQPFQDELLDALARFTATPLATHQPEENSCAEQ